MPALPQNLSDYVRRTLAKKGVEVMTSTRVMSCAAHGVEFEHGRLDADTIIWAAGVVASPAARWLDAQHDRAGRVKVGAYLSVPSHPNIFVVGDTAAVTDQPGIHCPTGEADGSLCRPAHRRARGGRAVITAVSLSPHGRSRHHRTPGRGG